MVAVAPLAGAWIETFIFPSLYRFLVSRPLRARGLKLLACCLWQLQHWSRPLRARGLKPASINTAIAAIVAPLAGAWIETLPNSSLITLSRRAPCGRVD